MVYPEWLVVLVQINPLTYAVDALRGAFIHFNQFDPRLGPMVAPPAGDEATSGLKLFRFVEQEQEEAEMVRVFYVAVTRADAWVASGDDDWFGGARTVGGTIAHESSAHPYLGRTRGKIRGSASG